MRLQDSWPELKSLSPPWFWITKRDPSDRLITLISATLEDCCIRRVNAESITDQVRLHDELASTFQFPWYYGRNFNAAIDCLRDLTWCESNHRSFLVIVTNADKLISVSPDTIENPLVYLMDISARIGTEMATAYQWSDDEVRPPTSFKFLFQASDHDSFERLQLAVRRHSKSFGLLK